MDITGVLSSQASVEEMVLWNNQGCFPKPWSWSSLCVKPLKPMKTPEQVWDQHSALSLGGRLTWEKPQTHRSVRSSSEKGWAVAVF